MKEGLVKKVKQDDAPTNGVDKTNGDKSMEIERYVIFNLD